MWTPSARKPFCGLRRLVGLVGLLSLQACRCDKAPLGDLSTANTVPTVAHNSLAEPRFPNHAAILYREQGSDGRVCWYLRPKEGESGTELLTQKAFLMDEFRNTFQNKIWRKAEFVGLNDDLLDALGRVLLRPFTAQNKEVLMVDVGPAGFDWLLKGVSLVKGAENSPGCPKSPN
jgi:hypothetical protein